ncbi:MAG: bis-aminopropyl spermidine synthase family protein [Deltaproteobacteria bacterium]|nr:bis-aminopropyl spermidine synthase family protein [Deltaproteobacteria bacterium]
MSRFAFNIIFGYTIKAYHMVPSVNMDLKQLAQRASDKSKIKVTQKDVERLLGALIKNKNPWDVIDKSDFPVPAVFESIKALEKSGLVSVLDNGFHLTDEGKKVARKLHPVEDISCRTCKGTGIGLEGFSEIKQKFLKIHKMRPSPLRKFDQGYITPTTTLSRFALAYERGDIVGKEIFVLGDDDLISIVLGISRLPKRITVVEIDRRLTDFIQETGVKVGFEVDVQSFDLREPIPKEYLNKYDTFFTDPPETLKAADAFIGRGIAALKGPGSAGYFGFTRREASLSKWHDLQKMLLKYGIVFTDIIHNFNEYVNWGYEEDTRAWRLSPVKVRPRKNWYRSGLYRFETLEGFKGNTKDYGNENIYEDKESSTT